MSKNAKYFLEYALTIYNSFFKNAYQYSIFMLIIKKMFWVFYYYISLNLVNTNENDSNLFKMFASP